MEDMPRDYEEFRKMFSFPAELRYDRQMRIEGWNQEKLLRASVLVVGVGATGCELAKNLTLMGLGSLILVDNDVIELSNLSRQMLFTDEDLGKPKVRVAKEKLIKMNPLIKIEDYYEDVRKLDPAVFEKVDVICSCLDNWPVRRWVNSIAVELNKPLVDVSMEGLYANLQTVIPGKTACLECYGEELIPREIQLAECTLRRRRPEDLVKDLGELNIRIDLELAEKLFEVGIKTLYDLKYSQAQVLEKLDNNVREKVHALQELLKPKTPALQSIAATISGMAATEVVKILHSENLGKIFSGLLVYDGYFSRFTTIRLRRKEECFVCGDYVKTEGTYLEVNMDETILDLKKKIAETFGFPDPEILYKKWKPEDSKTLRELSVESGDVIYVETSRRFTPLPVKLLLTDNSRK